MFTGDLLGPTVVTQHRVRDGAKERTYLLIHGRLDRSDPAITSGAKPEAGAALGFARSSEGGGLVEIYVEARQVREGVTLAAIDGKKLKDGSVAVAIDLRNVLPKR